MPKACGSHCCPANWRCAIGQCFVEQKKCPDGFPVLCADGTCCPDGTTCAGPGKCMTPPPNVSRGMAPPSTVTLQ
ncbi:MAG: hypothetical protein ABSE49_31090 [Polyangiaceae bacterium]